MNNVFDTSPGWLIHHYPIRDNLLLLYILTPSQLIKGFYRVPKHKHLRILPQAFLPYHIIWRQRGDNINIQSLEPVGPGYQLKDLKLWLGMYLNELVFHLLRHEHSEGEFAFFPLYEAILAHEEACPESLLRQFEYRLLEDCGFCIDFSLNAQAEPIKADLNYRYVPGEGFNANESGYPGRDLLMIAAGNFDSVGILKHIFRQTIDMVLDGKVLNSRVLLREWLKRFDV